MFFNIFHRNPVGQISSGTVGWPRYTENNRHVLNIHGSQRSSDHTLNLSGNIMWEPVSIAIDNNEQTCAFWNKFLPSLKGKQSEKCFLKKARPNNRIKQKIFLPMKIRPRSTTTVNPKVYSENVSERTHGIDSFLNSMSNNEVIPRSRPSTSFISLNSLLQRDQEYLELPSPIVISTPTIKLTTRSPSILTTSVLTTTQRTTATAKKTTTTVPSTTTTSTTTRTPRTTTTTIMKITTTTRMTTVTQSSQTMKRRPTVKFNPYIFVSSTMQSNRNRNAPKLRKEDVGGNALLNYTSEIIERNPASTSKKKHEQEPVDIEENGLVKINISDDKQKEESLQTKQPLHFEDRVSFVPLTKSPNSTEDNANLIVENSHYDENVTIEDDSSTDADSPFLIFGEQGRDSTLVKFRMSVVDKQTTSSLFPKSRIPSSTPKTTLHKNKKYSIYKSNNPQDSAILVVNDVINANQPSHEIGQTKFEGFLSSEIQSGSNLQVSTDNKHSNTRYSQHSNDNTIPKNTRRPGKQRPYHRYPLPPVYDPFNTKTYLKSDHIRPRKTHSVETNGRSKVRDYFRPRVDDYFGTRKQNEDPIHISSNNKQNMIKKVSYFPV